MTSFFTSTFTSLKFGVLNTFLVSIIWIKHIDNFFEFNRLFRNNWYWWHIWWFYILFLFFLNTGKWLLVEFVSWVWFHGVRIIVVWVIVYIWIVLDGGLFFRCEGLLWKIFNIDRTSLMVTRNRSHRVWKWQCTCMILVNLGLLSHKMIIPIKSWTFWGRMQTFIVLAVKTIFRLFIITTILDNIT